MVKGTLRLIMKTGPMTLQISQLEPLLGKAPETLQVPELKLLLRESGLTHVGIIMDGNRRWAKKRLLPHMMGHSEGVNSLKRLVKHLSHIGLNTLTAFAFSTENWRRSPEEVSFLMNLFDQVIRSELDELHQNQVRLSFLGDLSGLSNKLRDRFQQAEDQTLHNKGLHLQLATNYGGRQEILNAVRLIARQVAEGAIEPEAIELEHIQSGLYNPNVSDPQLIIRPSGEARLSNFLLWQSAYAEFIWTSVLWPDFMPADFNQAVQEFIGRDRRFGA
jgi:undecaprenyl diphosphate synthase